MVLLEFENFDFLQNVRPNLVPKLKYASTFMKIDTVNRQTTIKFGNLNLDSIWSKNLNVIKFYENWHNE